MAHPWPLFDLRLRTPRLELRLPTDDDLLGLMEVARAGVHDPAATPFKFPWDELPSPAFERNFLLHWWASRGSWKPERWTLTLAAVAGGRPIGIQDLLARDFAHRRTVSTGSWLGQAYQRRGYGTEMRAAVLSLLRDSAHAWRSRGTSRATKRPLVSLSDSGTCQTASALSRPAGSP